MSLPPKGSTASLKKHLLAVWKATKIKPKQLREQPSLPQELAYLWSYYIELQSTAALTYSEIDSWSRLTQKHVNAEEVSILRQLDVTYWQVINGRSLPSDNQS